MALPVSRPTTNVQNCDEKGHNDTSWGHDMAWCCQFNSSPPGQYGRHFADDVFKYIFLNEKFVISIQISLKIVPKGPFDNNSALVQVMAWRRTGDKPLPEPMRTQLTDAYMSN